jgi:hypothetical protein
MMGPRRWNRPSRVRDLNQSQSPSQIPSQSPNPSRGRNSSPSCQQTRSHLQIRNTGRRRLPRRTYPAPIRLQGRLRHPVPIRIRTRIRTRTRTRIPILRQRTAEMASRIRQAGREMVREVPAAERDPSLRRTHRLRLRLRLLVRRRHRQALRRRRFRGRVNCRAADERHEAQPLKYRAEWPPHWAAVGQDGP